MRSLLSRKMALKPIKSDRWELRSAFLSLTEVYTAEVEFRYITNSVTVHDSRSTTLLANFVVLQKALPGHGFVASSLHEYCTSK